MGCRLACGLRAVVTARTGTTYRRVIKADSSPGRGDVAGITRRVRSDVCRWLSLGVQIVVTRRTSARDGCVVIAHPAPAHGVVAGVATRNGLHMPEGFSRCDRVVVAISASLGQPLEGASHMARLACERLVGAVEREACRQVIKGLWGLLGECGSGCQERQQRQQDDHNDSCSDVARHGCRSVIAHGCVSAADTHDALRHPSQPPAHYVGFTYTADETMEVPKFNRRLPRRRTERTN